MTETAFPGRTGDESAAIGITATDLRLRYGATQALAGLTLRVEPGMATGLVGRNGAGKSTLFRVLLGIEAPDSGSVGTTPSGLDRLEFLARTGFVPDQLSAYDWMTVGQAIDFVAALQPRFDRRWSDEVVAMLGLDRSKRLKALSRGMQARLAFALGVSHRPGLLLLDEPLIGVDAVSHDAILEILARLRCDIGSTILVASHALGDLAKVTDRIAFVDAGKVIEECSTDELVSETKRIIVRGAAPRDFVAPPETVHLVRRDDALIVTVRRFTRELLDRVRTAVPGTPVDVVDLTIAEACADRMRAMETGS
jgi:ABC-2 type transport system ATP-binding protein